MTKNILTKATSLTLATAFALVGFGSDALAYGVTGLHVNDAAVQAAAQPGDIRQMVGQASDHILEFTLDAQTNIDAGENIVVTFSSGTDAGEFFNFSGISAADVVVYANGVQQTAGTNFNATITTVPAANVDGVITINAVTAFATAGQEIAIIIGDGDGTTYTGTGNKIVNPTVASEDAHVNETGLGEENFYKITINGNFGTEAGVTHAVKAATIFPVLSDDQVHVYAYIMPQLVFNMDSGDASYVNGNNTSNGGTCTTGTADDDDANCDFFDQYANSIDFGMPSSTQTNIATPTHPSNVMNGGVSTSQNATAISDNAATNGGAHGFHVGTNAVNGLVTTVWGQTLTHANDVATIAAVGSTAAAAAAGTEQFGFCLSQDTNGTAGTTATTVVAPVAGPDGIQNAVIGGATNPAVDCSTGTYTFAPTAAAATTPVLNTLVNSDRPTSMTFFDMEYMMNVNAASAAGVYDTNLTFITTGLF